MVFKLDSDIEVALNDVRSKIADISNSFPDDMKLPSVSKLNSDAWPSFWISISSSKHNSLELTKFLDNQIKSILEKLPTVGDSKIFGAQYYTMHIEPINSKMAQHKLTPLDLEKAIKEQNRDYPAGIIKTQTRNFSLKLSGTINNMYDAAKDVPPHHEGILHSKLGRDAS